jgi:hypothetical protein
VSSRTSALPTRLHRPGHHSVFLQLDSDAPARPREKLKLATAVLTENGKSQAMAMRQPIRSLIPPDLISEKSRTKMAVQNRIKRRNSESSMSIKSIKSFTSTGTPRKRRDSQRQTLATMPSEILDLIFMHLSQDDLHALTLTNSNLTEAAAGVMYREPIFATTYRYAQFAYIVSHNK